MTHCTMQVTKFFSLYAGTSSLMCYEFKRPLCVKLNILKCRKYFFRSTQVICPKLYSQLLFGGQKQYAKFSTNEYLNSVRSFSVSRRFTSTDQTEKKVVSVEEPEKLSLYKRYKKMLKEYWYVLIPVHMATSSIWFGLFYYVAKSGFDIVPFLEMLSVPETIVHPFRNSSLGSIAVASALYKLATPARYMVTLGATTVAIKQLTKRGLIKPVPSKAKFKTMIKSKLQAKKDNTES